MKVCENCAHQGVIRKHITFSRFDKKRVYKGDAFVCRSPGMLSWYNKKQGLEDDDKVDFVLVGKVCWFCDHSGAVYFKYKSDE